MITRPKQKLETRTWLEEVVREINSKWGNEVIISGPILKIPYKTFKKEKVYLENSKSYETKTEEIIQYAYLFPDDLQIQSEVNTKEEPLKRSIYESVVFTADLSIEGYFPKIDLLENDILPEDIVWEKISVFIKSTNLKGIRNNLEIQLANQTPGLTPTQILKDHEGLHRVLIANAA